MMDTRCVKILMQDERACRVILSYWSKTLGNMIITVEDDGAEVSVTSLSFYVQIQLIRKGQNSV